MASLGDANAKEILERDFPDYVKEQAEADETTVKGKACQRALGKKRKKHLAHYIREGRAKQTDKTVEQLCDLKLKCNKGLKHVEVNCIDEAELRNQFKGQGVGHKFFMKKDFSFEIRVAACGTPVAQIWKKPDLKIPRKY